MSYSFTIKAATRGAAKVAVAAEVDKIVASQAAHARDREAILANANAIIDILADESTKDVTVSCNGYVSWTKSATPEEAEFSSVGINCSAYHSDRS